MCSLCWPCRADKRFRAEVDWPGQCEGQVSARAQVRGRGGVVAASMALSCHSLPHQPMLASAVTLGVTALHCTLGPLCPLHSVSLSHTALPRCSELQLTALCPH